MQTNSKRKPLKGFMMRKSISHNMVMICNSIAIGGWPLEW